MMTGKTIMHFTATTDFYQLADGVDALDVIDQLHARQSQLDALLHAAVLDSDPLGEMHKTARQGYMSTCASLSDEIGELTKLLAVLTGLLPPTQPARPTQSR